MRIVLLCCLILAPAPVLSQEVSALGGVAEQMRANDPVSIVFERKFVHRLEDGTIVTNLTHQWWYRDGKGRVRIEEELGNASDLTGIRASTVHINDPQTLEVTLWNLGPRAEHTYTRFKTRMPAPMKPLPSVGSKTVMPRVVPPSHPDLASLPHTESDAEGVETIEGARCESLRSTTTYPVHSFGNDREISVVSENCVSEEFGMPIRILNDDPRTGSRTFSITSLVRGEPDPSLFLPPDDYKEKQARRVLQLTPDKATR